MKVRLFSSVKNIFTKKDCMKTIPNTNINYNQQLKTMQIPSNIIVKKELTIGDKLDRIMKLIIKRLDRIDQRNQEMLIQLQNRQPRK